MKFRSTLTMLLATASIGLTGPALAQTETETQTSMEVPEIAAEDVSSGQIVSFVNAMIALERIRAEYQPKIQALESEEERKALAAEADEAAKAAVTKVKGISPEEYIAIGRAANEDKELADKITTRIVEMRQKQQKRQTLQQPSVQQDGETAAEGEAETGTDGETATE